MSQPALLLRPDVDRPSLYVGDVVSAGSTGSVPCLGFYLSTNRSRDTLLADLLPEPGSLHVFNGILLAPTMPTYRLPFARPKDDPQIRTGIVFPRSTDPRPDWILTITGGVNGLTNNDGTFTVNGGLPVQIFDRKVTFRCLTRTKFSKDDASDALKGIEGKLKDRGVFGIYGRSGDVLLSAEILLSEREYPLPQPRDPESERPTRRQRK